MPTPRALSVALVLISTAAARGQDSPDLRPTAYAVTDARVVVGPGQVLDKATVVVRDGRIEAVGPDAKVPPDAAVTDGKGLTVYAGFLDAGSPRGYDAALRRATGGPPAVEDTAADPLVATKADNRKGLTPEFGVQTALKFDEEAAAPWRRVGVTAQLVTPDGGYLSGTSAVVSLSGAVPRDALLREAVALHGRFGRVLGPGYPSALMGVVAHTRQTFLDAGWLRRQQAAYEARGRTGKRPAADPCLEALWPALDGTLRVAFEADTADDIHRALDLAAEFKLKPIIVGGRHAFKVTDRLKAEGVPVLLRIDFTPADDKENELPVRVREDRERLRQLDVGCAAALHKAGVKFAFATVGLTGPKAPTQFRENVRKVITAGLPADAALAALTTDAAEILGVAAQVGQVTAGRAAHLLVADGDFQAEKTKFQFAFADGVRFDLSDKATPPDAKVAAKSPEAPPKDGPPADKSAKGDKKDEKADRGKTPFDGDVFRALIPTLDAAEQQVTETEADRKPATRTGGDVLIRGATVLTLAGETLPKADVLVRGGKITGVGTDIPAPDGVKVIDAAGMFLMPGIIDTHCHFSISGGVNDGTLSVVPEIRVRDVINSEDTQIYKALAGGVTTARLLHGSANVVGGQDAVIKLKFGTSAKEMLVADAPRGVKFALGENVKRTDGRFPNSRLGVEAVLVRAFTEATTYRQKWAAYEKSKDTGNPLPEPRRDLRLEALADIVAGDLRIHSHCYRADEILMLLRVADRFGVKVKSLQHVLEGYKVAPEIAAHGASVSLFADWWAYKIEAFDAIPYGAKLLRDAGVSVCLKSDDNELMRHLNQEAAKLVKYCGFAPDEALHAITLNPARQLGLQARLGTIEVGKDADLALFNGHPLNGFSRCEMTLVEGEVYFQRAAKFAPAAVAAAGPAKPPAKFAALPDRPRGTYVLKNGTVHTPGKPPSLGSVVVAAGKIQQVTAGDQEPTAPADALPVDCTGLHLFPGLIEGSTVLGLVEIESADETNDSRDGGDFQPDLRAGVGINPDSELIPVARANGVTAALTRPAGSLMPGQGALIGLAGWVPAEMAILDAATLHIEYPAEAAGRRFNPASVLDPDDNAAKAKAKFQREEKLRLLKQLFETARRYAAGRKAGLPTPTNPRLEALLPYANGDRPVVFTAESQADILAALKLADELMVKAVLCGGTEAWKVAAELKRRDVPVILGPVMSLPRDAAGERYDAPYAAAAKLHAAGVKFCLRSKEASNTRNLPYEAATAVAYGLPPDAALRAITLSPAEILGVADRLGSIESGKRADLVIASGDLLQTSTEVLSVFVAGRPYAPTNKQTRLYDKYRQRLDEAKPATSAGSGGGGQP